MAAVSLPADTTPQQFLSPKPRSLWQNALRYLFRQRSAVIGMIILGLLILVAAFAPILATHDPIQTLIGIEDVKKRAAPCIHLLGCAADQPQHLFGTDGNVRDLFSRVIYGARLSLQVGILSVSFAILVGAFLGAVAGYAGGWVDNLIMRIMDVLLAFPTLILAIAIVTVLGPGLINTLIAIAIVSIPGYARIMRASVLAIKEQDYVLADRALGVPPMRILFSHILPNALTPLVVQATLGIASAILDAAALSFLGLGAQPPTPEWGSMIGQERNQVFRRAAFNLLPWPGPRADSAWL